MGDAEKPPKRHRVHSGLTGTRLDRAAVALEVWPAPIAPGEAQRASHRLVLTSVEWVDLIAGVIVGEVRVLDRILYPVALALQAMPVVAIAPLVIVWFGIGIPSKLALVAIGTFFVMFLNTVAGMHATPTELSDMGRAFGGSRWQIALRIKLPNAWDYIFGALEVCAALSFILCVVGEFLAAKAGLGYYLRAASNNIDAAAMSASLIVLSLLATTLALAVRAAHHRTVFWKYRRH